VLRAEAGPLPQLLAQPAQGEMEAGQVAAAPLPLPGVFVRECMPGHIPRQAVEPVPSAMSSLTGSGTTQPMLAR
jgi:hypothetical protein